MMNIYKFIRFFSIEINERKIFCGKKDKSPFIDISMYSA